VSSYSDSQHHSIHYQVSVILPPNHPSKPAPSTSPYPDRGLPCLAPTTALTALPALVQPSWSVLHPEAKGTFTDVNKAESLPCPK
jgi:hypothetical protein